jgi:hypothetical protein
MSPKLTHGRDIFIPNPPRDHWRRFVFVRVDHSAVRTDSARWHDVIAIMASGSGLSLTLRGQDSLLLAKSASPEVVSGLTKLSVKVAIRT